MKSRSLSWLFDCHRSRARNIKKRLFVSWLAPKKGVIFSFIYFFKSFCIYYIPHNYVIPQAMPHAIPQTHSTSYPHRCQAGLRTGRAINLSRISSWRPLLCSFFSSSSFWVLCGVNKSNCLKPFVGKRWSEWKSEFQIEFNIKLNWFIHERFANLSNHFQFLVPTSVKRFSTKGEQIAIHQLNNYNKALINRNLAKTPTLFTQAVYVMTHTGSWVKLLLSLISIVKRSTSHLVREMNQTQGSKHCFLFWKTLRKRAIWRIFKIS